MIFHSGHPRAILLGLLGLATGIGLLVWHFMADTVIQNLVAKNPFLAEGPPVTQEVQLPFAGIPGFFQPGYYSGLYLKEYKLSEQDTGRLPANADNVRAFIEKHRLTFLPPPFYTNEASDKASIATYRAALASVSTAWRSIQLVEIIQVIQKQNSEEGNKLLWQLMQDTNTALTALQSLTVPKEAERLHQYQLTAGIFFRNSVRQLTMADNDPIGALLAAGTLDYISVALAPLDQQGIRVIASRTAQDGKTSALYAMGKALGYPQASLATLMTETRVAGTRDPDPVEVACHLCLPVDELIQQGSKDL